jgi:hypothetical protein
MSVLNTNTLLLADKPVKHNYSCYCCGKTYKKRETLDKHIVLCEIIDKSKKKKSTTVENEEIIPSQKQMYNILVELTLKYKKLEEKMEEAQIWIDKAKRKTNIVEWLNKNVKPTVTFSNLFENQIIVTEENIEFLFKHTFIDTFFEVLIKNMELLKINDENSPIQSFTQKANKIYVYDISNTTESSNTESSNTESSNTESSNTESSNTESSNTESSNDNILFEELSRENLVKFGKQIHFKIVKELIEWKNKRGISVDECEKTSQIYNNALMKLMTVDFKQETVIGKIRTNLYSNFKVDMRSTF